MLLVDETMKVSRSSIRPVQMSKKHPRYGYHRITEMLKRDGLVVNAKSWRKWF